MVWEHHGYTCTVIDGDELAVTRPGSTEPVRTYLTNLRQWVAQEPEEHRAAIVSDFVGSLVAATEVEDDDVLDLNDFRFVRPLLRTRLYAEDFRADLEVVQRTVAPGLVEILVVDLPTSLLIVNAETVAGWGAGPDEVFGIARENVRADGPLEIEDRDFDGVRLCSLGGETEYVTAHALWAGDYPVTGTHGALIAVPAQGVVHACPVHGDDMPGAMNMLIRLAWAGYQDGPRSVSPNVYWWRDGELRLAGAVAANGDDLEVSISSEFQILLERLVQG
jgi:hypothetical protein